MAITPEERQKRIDLIKKENEAIKQLNDLSDMKNRVRNEKSLVDQIGIIEDEEIPEKQSAIPSSETNL